jgi:4-deoxy-L-threo-5-hexosulose-uronate ketol-isomerase
MRSIPSVHPENVPTLPSAALRDKFLVSGLFAPGAIELAYWEVDRTILGGAVPLAAPLELTADAELRAASFCARRELGVINLGGAGAIETDGVRHAMAPLDGLYVGRGTQRVVFHSDDAAAPAKFYLLSYPAHREYPTRHIAVASLPGEQLGTAVMANQRRLRKYIAPGLVESCQLVMGLTVLASGQVWNTMPCHTHMRRSEVYCYAGIAPDQAVFHFMGEPDATRHLVLHDLDVVISPSWSIHSGVGTASYSFVWGMGGENQEFADMDQVAIADLR